MIEFSAKKGCTEGDGLNHAKMTVFSFMKGERMDVLALAADAKYRKPGGSYRKKFCSIDPDSADCEDYTPMCIYDTLVAQEIEQSRWKGWRCGVPEKAATKIPEMGDILEGYHPEGLLKLCDEYDANAKRSLATNFTT